MAFPAENSAWPPPEWDYWYRKYLEWAAWYSGDPEQLADYYSSLFPDTDQGRFWARIERNERRTMVHLPIASDVAATSANLLFSEAPDFQYDEKADGGDRVKAFIDDNGLHNLLLEGAEMAAGLSGLFLKLDVDPSIMGVPIVSVVTPYHALPEFQRGRLKAVTFWSVVRQEDSGTVWRLFEDRRVENGQLVVRYRLYDGRDDRIGRLRGLNSIEETSQLGLQDMIYNINALATVYIPNMRPNRLQPGSPLGVADYQGAIGLLDSLDEAWSALMREIRLGAAKLLVDEEILDEHGRYNTLDEVFVKLKMSDLRVGNESYDPIEQIQFDMRIEEMLRGIEALSTEIITRCGYSPQTFGFDIQGRAESGTALRIRERKSLLTREKKSRYWRPALRSLFWQAQLLDVESALSTGYTPQDVDVILQDSVVPDPKEISETIRNLEQARAISTYMKVKLQHPDWDETAVAEEVERIHKERGGDVPLFEGIP